MFATWVLLLFPFIFGFLFLFVRLGFLWLEREQIAFHVKRVYGRSLLYVNNGTKEGINYRLLAIRQALFSSFFTEKRVYRSFLHGLREATGPEDTLLEESYEFLEHTSL